MIFNHYQWEFLLSIQEVSEVTLNLIDWAFEESPATIKSPPSFVEKMMAGVNCLVKDQSKDFPLLSEKINEDPQLSYMTVDFARELHREWPPLHFLRSKTAQHTSKFYRIGNDRTSHLCLPRTKKICG